MYITGFIFITQSICIGMDWSGKLQSPHVLYYTTF